MKTEIAYTPALLVLALAATLAGCKSPPAAAAAAAAPGRAVTVVRVERHVISGALQASGDLMPLEEAAVLPEVDGYRVAAVIADVGQYVKKGEVLARLDPRLIQTQLAQQQALVGQSQAQAMQAEDQAERVRGLDESGVLSEEQIRQRRFQAQAARATVKAQAAALRDLRTRASLLAVTAPVSGVILEKSVRPGDLSVAGASAWFRLARDGIIELQAQMAEEDLSRVHQGQVAQVTLSNGATVVGRVRLVSPQVDPQSNLGYVRITLPVRDDIRAGGFAHASFGASSAPVVSVPETAVRYDADGASVMVVAPDQRVRRVAVQTGARGGGLIELAQGPSTGARVVRNAADFLLDGDQVRPIGGPQ